MTIFDTPELSMLHDAASRFASDHAQMSDSEVLWARFAEMGWLGLGLPEHAGGLGPCAVTTVMEAMGRHAISSPYIGGAVVTAHILSRLGREDDFAALVEGRLRVSVDASLLLPTCGSRLTASIADDVIRVSGDMIAVAWTKPDAVLTTAIDGNGEQQLLLLPLASAQVQRQPITLADMGQGVRLRYAGMSYPRTCILAAGAEYIAVIEGARTEGLLAAAADNLGAMQALYEQTLSYAKLRKQFGRAIGSFQTLQFRLTDMWIKLDEARSLVMAAAEALAAQETDARHKVAAAWMQTLWSGRLISEEAVQMHGAIGMTDEFVVGRYVKRLLVNEQLFGGDEMHLARYCRRIARPEAFSQAA